MSTDDIERLLERRAPLFEHRDAVRLSHHELAADLTIDDYAGYLLFTDYGERDRRDEHRRVARRLLDALGSRGLPARGAVSKRRPDNLSRRAGEAAPRILQGDAPPDRFEVREGPATFLVSFTDAGFGTGLFLDMYPGRRFVREHARGRRVLNLFSYTGAFSIAAALGGATEVIEVDTSRKWLDWSRANQKLNALAYGRVRQRPDDAIKVLARQKDASFDLILCDPPAYANPKKGKRFTVEAGYKQMAGDFARVLAPGGTLLACCNHAQTPGERFRTWLPTAWTLERWIAPGPDFPAADYLKVAVCRRP